jgi:hypothetical protein
MATTKVEESTSTLLNRLSLSNDMILIADCDKTPVFRGFATRNSGFVRNPKRKAADSSSAMNIVPHQSFEFSRNPKLKRETTNLRSASTINAFRQTSQQNSLSQLKEGAPVTG